MLSEKPGEVSGRAIVGSTRVAVESIIEVGGGMDRVGGSGRSCPAIPFFGPSPSLSIGGRKRRIAKTLPANLDLGFQKGIWVRR